MASPKYPTVHTLATGEDTELARATISRQRVLLLVKTSEGALALVRAECQDPRGFGSITSVQHGGTIFWPSRAIDFFRAVSVACDYFGEVGEDDASR